MSYPRNCDRPDKANDAPDHVCACNGEELYGYGTHEITLVIPINHVRE